MRTIGAIGLAAALSAAANATITITDADGVAVPPENYTMSFDPVTGGWNIVLSELYAPWLDTVYEIHANGGETIDLVLIDIDGPVAGSPLIVRVVGDAPLGLDSVHNIIQTGNAETLLNRVEVTNDIGAVSAQAIGWIIAGRDVVGPIIGTTPSNPVRGISYVIAGRDVLGDLAAPNGHIRRIEAGRHVGTPAAPISVLSRHGLWLIDAEQDIHANVNTRMNGGSGAIWRVEGNRFVGTLEARAIEAYSGSSGYGHIDLAESFEGELRLGESFTSGATHIRVPVGGLLGQLIFNVDAVPGAVWDAPVQVGAPGDPGAIELTGPGYDEAPGALGGGSVAMVPFRLHWAACDPPNGSHLAVGANDEPVAVNLRFYGPVMWNSAPVEIVRRPIGSTDNYAPWSLAEFTVDQPADEPGVVRLGVSEFGSGFEPGWEYRIEATDALRCDITGLPEVMPDDAFHLIVEPIDTPCVGDVTGDGFVRIDDLLTLLTWWGPVVSPAAEAADFDGNGAVDIVDLLAVLANWGDC